jgi:hypothetical protein
MKKAFLALSFSAAVIASSLSSPVEANARKKACDAGCKGRECTFQTNYKVLPENSKSELANVLGKSQNDLANKLTGKAFWKAMSLSSQRTACKSCGWGHVKSMWGNYCDKGKRPGNY